LTRLHITGYAEAAFLVLANWSGAVTLYNEMAAKGEEFAETN
jgi:hypothetical protein